MVYKILKDHFKISLENRNSFLKQFFWFYNDPPLLVINLFLS